MEAAARADGVTLIINSAFRSNTEQAALFARNPDAKWVVPPGRSLHRLGTELDLGPPAASAWLAPHGEPFPLHPAILLASCWIGPPVWARNAR